MKPHTIQMPNGRLAIDRDDGEGGGGAFKIGDVAYILFRHKWKILLCFVAGLFATVFIWKTHRPTYVSDAKLLIRYVLETRSMGPIDTGDQVKYPDRGGDNIIASEIELLTSLDLAEEVVSSVGATNILQSQDGNNSKELASVIICKNLDVKVKPGSSVIAVSFQHRDPDIARQVVTTLIARYLKMHTRVHRALDVIEDLARETDQKRSTVEQTEAELRRVKNELGIVSVQDSQKALADLISRVRMEALDAEAGLAESRAALARIPNAVPLPAPLSTNSTPIPPDIARAYQSVAGRIEVLRRKEQELLLQFTPTSSYVKKAADQIAEAVSERDRLVAATPGLTNLPFLQPNPAERSAITGNVLDPTVELARAAALEAKVKILNEQLEKARSEALKISDKESDIAQLERKLQIGEKQYAYYSTSLEEARVNDAVSSSRVANISVVQTASPAYRATSKLVKLLGGALFGGLGLGIGLALLIEFYTDQSVRRPRQVTEALNLPLFLSLPRLSLKSVAATNGSARNGTVADGVAGTKGHAAANENETGLSLYAEALRDRLIMHFQIKELHHKPKLIGLTSCGRGAGVTTIATSLAASLSETGEGNVLYVDVNQHTGPSVHPFRQGRPVVGINDALAAETRNSAMVSHNLYMVSLTEPNSRRVGILPKKLASLVPQIQASDYDYIIFDLPPVTQTSATARVSGLLDMTVLVLESEKTHSDLAQQAVGLLGESHTEMVAVLNKHRRYLPRKLDTEL